MTPHTAHDLGGQPGFGNIDRSRAQFAGEWERKVFGMTLACGMLGRWNLDQSRYAREQMEREHYFGSTYYEHWLHGLELLLVECGLVSEAELRSGAAARRSAKPEVSAGTAVSAEQVAGILGKGAPTELPASHAPLFTVGERIKVRDFTPQTHCRAPAYTRARQGIVAQHHGAHVFPDHHAAHGKKQPQHLYSVRFTARELWPEHRRMKNAEVKVETHVETAAAVYADLFEPYLQPAHATP